MKIRPWVFFVVVLFDFFYFCLGVFQGRLDFGCPRGIFDSGLATFLALAFVCVVVFEFLLFLDAVASISIASGLVMFLPLFRTHKLKQNTADYARAFGTIDSNI